MAIERFEEIEAWKSARELVRSLYDTAGRQPELARDFALWDQLKRAAISIMGNIAEGFDARSRPEFLRFLGYAYRSATEVQSHLYVALDQGYVAQCEFDALYAQTVSVKRLLSGFIRYLKECPR